MNLREPALDRDSLFNAANECTYTKRTYSSRARYYCPIMYIFRDAIYRQLYTCYARKSPPLLPRLRTNSDLLQLATAATEIRTIANAQARHSFSGLLGSAQRQRSSRHSNYVGMSLYPNCQRTWIAIPCRWGAARTSSPGTRARRTWKASGGSSQQRARCWPSR